MAKTMPRAKRDRRKLPKALTEKSHPREVARLRAREASYVSLPGQWEQLINDYGDCNCDPSANECWNERFALSESIRALIAENERLRSELKAAAK